MNKKNTIICCWSLLLTIMSFCAQAQITNIDIGTGTTTTDNSPIQRLYDYSASELLYLGTEIGNTGFITGLGFYKASGDNTITIDSVYIYLKETSATVLTTTSGTSGYTLAYRGAFPNAATGWLTVNFNMIPGFSYSTASNLSILIVRPYQALTSARPYWRYTDNTGSRNAWYRNNTAAWSGTMNEVSTWRPNIRLIFTAVCSGIPTAGTTTAAATPIPCHTSTTLGLAGNSASSGIHYQWQYNTSNTWVNFGTNAATQVTPPVTQATQFRCVLTCTSAGGGAANSVPVTVHVNPVPVSIGNDTTICPGVIYNLNAGNTGSQYAWNTGATTQSIQVSNAGTYSVLVTLSNGCTGSDAISITNGIVPVNNLPATTNLCEGETATLNAGNTGSTFLWTPGNAATQIITATTGGNYSVQIRSGNGCTITSTTGIIMRPLPVAALHPDTSICPGAQITLDAGNTGYSYDWSTGDTTQMIGVTDSATYSVTITSPFNCILTEEQRVAYLPAPYAEGFNFIPLFYESLGKVRFSPLNPSNIDHYEWDFGDGSPVSLQVTPEHTYVSGGDYTVSLTVFNGCGQYSVGQQIHVDVVTGLVTLLPRAAAIMLYPNPARSSLYIRSTDPATTMLNITVCNVAGSVVYRSRSDQDGQHYLDASGWAQGIYLVKIETDKGTHTMKLQVLQ